MTMETGESKGVCEGSGSEFEGKGVQELVLQEDERRSGECNGIAFGEAEGVKEVVKDDVDGSYVFVNGDSDGLSEKDLDVVDKMDLDRSQRDEPSVESDDFSERDLGEDSRVEISVSNTEGCAVENSALTPTAVVEFEGRTSECKESGDCNEEKGDLNSSIEEVPSEKEKKVELILENGYNCKQNDAPNLDLDVETPNIQEETSADITEGCYVPDSVPEIENASFKEQECGEPLGNTIDNHDPFEREVLVNGNEDQEDGESLNAAPEIKVKDSEPVAVGAESVSLPSVNTQEIMSINSEEKLPAEEQSEIVVSGTHESESLPLGDEEMLASNGTEDSPPEGQVKIVVTERSESESLSHGNEDVPASNCTGDYPAAEQTEILVIERSGTESLPLGDEETTSSKDAEVNPVGQPKVEITEISGLESLALKNEEELALNSTEGTPAVEQSAHSSLEQESKTQSAMLVADKNSEIISISAVDEGKIEADISNGDQESSRMLPSCSVKQADTEAEAPEVLVEKPESFRTFPVGDEASIKEVTDIGNNIKIELEVDIESAESKEDVSALSANDMDSISVNEEITIEDKVYTCPPVNGTEPEAEVIIDSLGRHYHISAFPEVEATLEENGETICAISGNNRTQVTEKESEENTSPVPDNGATQAAEESEENIVPVAEGSALPVEMAKDAPNDNVVHVGGVKIQPEFRSGHVEHGECLTDTIEEIQSANKNDPNTPASAEDNATEQGPENEALVAPTNDIGSLSLAGQKVDTDVKSLPIFIVRVPRFSDDKLKMQIQHAQQEVDEKTEIRGSIRLSMQKQKAVCAEYWRKVEYARKEERAARDAVASRRQELDSIQSVLNKLKNANSISDLDNRIHKLQHRISHETNTLKEEKSLIREMNQLKQSREQLASSLASDEELQKAFEMQEEMETRLKHLKEGIDTLRKETQQAEAYTKDAKSRYDGQCEYLRDLQSQFKAADDLRQEVYRKLKNLKKESYLKNEHFYSYKDDLKVATNYVFSGDREALRNHCSNQVEKLMELWNKNDEFRHQYVKANLPSTLRRFRTLDARSLGPDEEPVMMHNPTEKEQKENILSPHVSKNNAPGLTTGRKEEKAEAPLSAAKMNLTDGPTLPQKSQSQKPKKVTKPATGEVVPNRESEKEAEKEMKRTMDEEEQARKAEELARKAEELARKEEELRKAKEAAEMKEQLRLQQIAKAKEAEERKKRKAEKAQAKAEIKAQKEAELREKKREKKEKKKERKSTTTTTESVAESEAPAVDADIPPESVQEQPAGKTPTAPSKRPSRPQAIAAKEYNKLKPLPPPLRNRGKRKMQTWMWVLLTALVVLALFMAGNYVSFSKFGLRNFSF
ncbi:hypothetical protein Taro_023971 [Colocasia esculenta]|uniref:Uncharacterized protein n=1 Tax=Colocasia esculenta TaxID=4460 RepID=A0A843VCD2_COLES|nr:hypothetical protein [Colocasia esculenta]